MKLLMLIVLCTVLSCHAIKDQKEKQKKESKKDQEKNQKRERCPVFTEEEYALALKLLTRSQTIPVDARSKLQAKMYQKISLFKLQQAVIHDPYLGREERRILIGGKILLPSNQIKECINTFYKSSKCDGAKKLCHLIKKSFYGIGEKLIQKQLNDMESHRTINPRFENRAPLKPVEAFNIMDRHQIDIVDLTSIAVTIDDREFRYVLSVIDVFSRFLWLRAISDKSANTVANELYNIYVDFGPPRIIQSDQGSEFKGHVKELCNLLGTKLIYSRSSHPQSQGKDERSHRTWKAKIHQDLLKTQNEGVCNWVISLPALQRIYNEGLHRSIGMSPYECMFGIHSNHIKNRIAGNGGCNEVEETEESEVTETDDAAIIEQHLSIIKEIRTKAKKKSDEASSKMVKSRLSKNPPSKYIRGDKVLIKRKRKDSRVSRGGSTITADKVFEGNVLESNFETHMYNVEYTNEKGKSATKWIPVSDITSKVHAEEAKKKKLVRSNSGKGVKITSELKNKQPERGLFGRNAIEKLQNMILESIRMSKTNDVRNQQLMQNAKQNGLELHSDNIGDGNCMFMALSHQLLTHGIEIDHGNLRQQLVDYMRDNPVLRSMDGSINLSDFIYGYENIDDYLNQMLLDRTWGDNLVLIAAANVFNARIVIVSSLPNADNIVIEPSNRQAGIELYLGHLHELHYVSLMQMETECNDYLCDEYLCDACGKSTNRTKGHNCVTMNTNSINTMSSFPLTDEEVEFFKHRIVSMISDLQKEAESNESQGDIVPLAKDHISLVFVTFLNEMGFTFEETIIDCEYFFKVPGTIMDMFLEFRKKLVDICGMLTLIVLTERVKQWLREVEGFNEEIQQVWFPLMYLITRRAKDCLSEWLDRNGSHFGVERVQEVENED